MKLTLALLTLALCSCNSTFVHRSASGAETAYSGSFASKAALDKTRIVMASGATIEKELQFKDEVESVSALTNLALLKAGIAAGVSTTNSLTSKIK